MLVSPIHSLQHQSILTLAEELGVAVGEEVDNGSRVGLGAADVLLPGLSGDERPPATVLVDAHPNRFPCATYSFSMLMVGAQSWLRRRWKSSQRVNQECPVEIWKFRSGTYASCRPCRSNRDGLVDDVSWRSLGDVVEACSKHVAGARDSLCTPPTCSNCFRDMVAYTCRGWCGGGAFRRVSPRPSRFEVANSRT